METMITEPVKTPIWPDPKLPTKGTRRTLQTMLWRISAANRMSQTLKAFKRGVLSARKQG
jgi:hypothetical protein